MRLRNTIIVLVLFAIVGGYAFIVGRYSQTEATQKLLDVKQDDIAKIELKYSDRDIVLERDKGKPWRIVKPIGADADQAQAGNLARAIADGVLVRTVDDKPADLAPFGLKPPTTTVTVTTFDNKTPPSIEVGKSTPIGFNTYVRLSNSPAVLLTEGAFSAGMNKTVNDLRVRDLMAFKLDDVQKLTIARDNGQAVEIDRDGDNWKIVKPAAYGADDTAVRMALSTLVNARASDFISDAPANVNQYGLEKPHLTATVVLKNGEQQSMLFGFKQNEQGKSGIYVRRGERAPVYAVAEYVMTSLDKSPLDFRDKTIVKFDPESVETVKVKNSDGEFTLKRAAGGKWDVIVGGKTSEGDIPVVERLLNQFRDLKGESIVADPMPSAQPFGLDNPALEITLTGKDGRELGTVRLAKISVKPTVPAIPGEPPQRTEYYANSSGSKAVYSLSDFSFAQLNKPAPLYMANAPASAAPQAAASPAK
ncbi:MAG TPA: DUF4340 domain-containing protein [Candidatus Binatus sp.]|uniref:DUF4340 domain-containing protein n=1 Tax=Candidatus Binatus sp. TaxID=2811406 RepID=UPI002B4805CE|nr:DUF4340 domain-containing protein [Candidatus Binatus sp.]HKN11687.1 DUF4340 domain-containing protein [Candidatus Binatus sp.]